MQFTDEEINGFQRVWDDWNGKKKEVPLAKIELSHEDIQTFVEAWKEDFGEVLTPECAESEILRLLHFFGTLEGILEEGTGPEELEEGDELGS